VPPDVVWTDLYGHPEGV